jgi:hypothetical protein
MSTKIKAPDASIPEEAEAPPPSALKSPNASGPSKTAAPGVLQQHRYQLGAGIVILVLVVALVGNSLLSRQYTAEGAVRQYLAALQSGDTSAAWSDIEVARPAQPPTATLTDRAAFQAALTASKPDLTSFDITGTTNTAAGAALVSFSYGTSSGSKQGKFVVQRSGEKRFAFYPVWHLLITPAVLELNLPKGSAGITIDGNSVALPAGKSTVAVLPVAHKVQFNGTEMLTTQTVAVDAFLALGQSVTYQPALTAAGLDKAKAAVKASFASCEKQTTTNPDPQVCPQHIDGNGSGTWRLVSDPTQDLAVSVDPDLNIAGVGHYQMVFAARGAHAASAGGYSAAIVLAANDLTIAGIQPMAGLPGLARPSGATDQDALALVGNALAKCATVQAETVADCPQDTPDLGVTSVHWKLTGNPLANATVNFDSNTGLLIVHGNYSMSVSYRMFGIPKTGTSWPAAYNAYLVWDGQALQLVNIAGAIS